MNNNWRNLFLYIFVLSILSLPAGLAFGSTKKNTPKKSQTQICKDGKFYKHTTFTFRQLPPQKISTGCVRWMLNNLHEPVMRALVFDVLLKYPDHKKKPLRTALNRLIKRKGAEFPVALELVALSSKSISKEHIALLKEQAAISSRATYALFKHGVLIVSDIDNILNSKKTFTQLDMRFAALCEISNNHLEKILAPLRTANKCLQQCMKNKPESSSASKKCRQLMEDREYKYLCETALFALRKYAPFDQETTQTILDFTLKGLNSSPKALDTLIYSGQPQKVREVILEYLSDYANKPVENYVDCDKEFPTGKLYTPLMISPVSWFHFAAVVHQLSVSHCDHTGDIWALHQQREGNQTKILNTFTREFVGKVKKRLLARPCGRGILICNSKKSWWRLIHDTDELKLNDYRYYDYWLDPSSDEIVQGPEMGTDECIEYHQTTENNNTLLVMTKLTDAIRKYVRLWKIDLISGQLTNRTMPISKSVSGRDYSEYLKIVKDKSNLLTNHGTKNAKSEKESSAAISNFENLWNLWDLRRKSEQEAINCVQPGCPRRMTMEDLAPYNAFARQIVEEGYEEQSEFSEKNTRLWPSCQALKEFDPLKPRHPDPEWNYESGIRRAFIVKFWQ